MKHVKRIFVYGTLRPDDCSNAPWTQPFIKGFKFEKCHFKDAIMFREKDHSYPSVSLLYTNEHFEEIRNYDQSLLKIYNDNKCKGITGYVLSIDETLVSSENSTIDAIKLFEQKLKEADEIEEYPELYKRSVIKVKPIDQSTNNQSQNQVQNQQEVEELLECFIYHRPDCQRDIVITSGDWLEHLKENPHLSNIFTKDK